MPPKLAKEAFQAATTDPSRVLLPLVHPAGPEMAAGEGHGQVPSDVADALVPPLHLLPGGRLAGERTAFHGPDGTAWKVRSHTFPAAWPRALPIGTTPSGVPIPPAGMVKDASAQAWQDMLPGVARAADAVPLLNEADKAKVVQERIESKERQLWSIVQRIVPAYPQPRPTVIAGAQHVNLVLTHANGLHKETFEPFLASLLAKLPKDIVVASIWSIDALNQGESASLNRKGIGAGLLVWPDMARDVIQFIKYYLPSTLPTDTVGDVLPRTEKILKPPRTVLIGHSLGACLACMVANTHPELIDTLIMMDPPVSHPPVYSVEGLAPLQAPDGIEIPRGMQIPDDPVRTMNESSMMSMSARRRDAWPSRSAAATLLSKSRFYGEWSLAARELFMEKGLVALPREDGSIPGREEETDDTPVGLSTSKYSEAATFGGVWSGSYPALSLLSGSFAKYWARQGGPNSRKGRTFTVYATDNPWYGMLLPYYERLRMVTHQNPTSLQQQLADGEQLRSDLVQSKVPGVPTEDIVEWPELLSHFSVKGEAAIFANSSHMLPQVQPDNVAAVVAGWLEETIVSRPTSHL